MHEDSITLRGMRFHARVGVLPHEQELPQPLEVDLTVWLAPAGPVVDYRGLHDDVSAVIDEGPLLYIEDVAEAIARRALARARVERVRVSVRKPHVALPGPLDHAEVTVVRSRPDAPGS
jgi:dihydroneopterin aldolase